MPNGNDFTLCIHDENKINSNVICIDQKYCPEDGEWSSILEGEQSKISCPSSYKDELVDQSNNNDNISTNESSSMLM